MVLTNHSVPDLFEQLGLPNVDSYIQGFVSSHRPLPGELCLADAHFWNDTQACFLRTALAEAADWAEVVDQLNVMLHE